MEIQLTPYFAVRLAVIGRGMSESSNGSGSIKYVDRRKPIKISPEAYEMVKHYADVCETSITKSIDECIKDYYQIVWLARIEHRLGKSLKLC